MTPTRTNYSDSIYTVSNLLSEAQCKELIALSEQIGYDTAPITTSHGFKMRPDIRNNTRVILDSEELAAELWKVVEPWVVSNWETYTAIALNTLFLASPTASRYTRCGRTEICAANRRNVPRSTPLITLFLNKGEGEM